MTEMSEAQRARAAEKLRGLTRASFAVREEYGAARREGDPQGTLDAIAEVSEEIGQRVERGEEILGITFR